MDFIEILKVILIGIVEGVTEWLPISSTGHMILVNEFIGGEADFFGEDLFLYGIQLGAILAIVTLYFKKLNPFAPSKTDAEKRETWQMWFKVVVGCIPAGLLVVFGLDEVCDALFQNYLTVAIMLILFGVLFIVIENRNKNVVPKVNDISAFLMLFNRTVSV